MNYRLKMAFLAFSFFAPTHLMAQRSYGSDDSTVVDKPAKVLSKGSSMINLSWGIITPDEFNGVTAVSYMDIPYAYSGTLFISYKYFLTKWLAVGGSVGLDHVEGNLTKGNPKRNGTGSEGTTGTYIRHTYTFAAPEILFKYSDNGRTVLYGYIGGGYTIARVQKAYEPRFYTGGYQNGVNTSSPVPYLSPTNPVYINEDHFNGQATLLGIRTGKTVAWSIEFGFGYKGVINTGVSLKL